MTVSIVFLRCSTPYPTLRNEDHDPLACAGTAAPSCSLMIALLLRSLVFVTSVASRAGSGRGWC